MLKRKLFAVLAILCMFAWLLPTIPYAEAVYENQALNKPVGVSVDMDTDPTGDKVVDGDVGGGQDAFDGFGRTTDNLFVGDAFYIDLLLPQTINASNMLWVTHTLSDVKYQIDWSLDNATWNMAVDHNATQRVGGSATWENQTFTEVTARYWRWMKTHDSKGYATNDPIRELELMGDPVSLDLSISILDMDDENWLYAGDKFYTFRAVALSTNATIESISFRFTDGTNTIQVSYVNATSTWTVDQGDDFATVGTPTIYSTYTNQIWNLTLDFPIMLKRTIYDSEDRDLELTGGTTDGESESWFVARENYFNIYNNGGLTLTIINGTAGRLTGGDTFEIYANENGTAYVEQIWRRLQHYHTQFSVYFSEAGEGEDQYMQDAAHDNGVDKSSDKGDWTLESGFYYYDRTAGENGTWVKGWHVLLQMEEGDEDEGDHYWTKVNASWYNNDVFVKSDVFAAYLEIEPAAQFRLWLDLWFNTQNSSQLHGGRVSSYYYGMSNTGWLAWSDWAPLQENVTNSMYFGYNKDNSSNTISAQQLNLVKVYYNLTRPTTQAGEADFRVSLINFELNEPKLAGSSLMKGVNTPVPVSPKVPDMAQTGFLAPLYSAISGIGNFIVSALAYATTLAWQGISTQFPWFTGFWEDTYKAAVTLYDLSTIIWVQLRNGLTFLLSIIWIITAPLDIIHQAWIFITDMYGEIFGGVNATEFITVFVILIFGTAVFEAAITGDIKFLINLTKQAWAIANTILTWMYRIAKLIIDTVVNLVPFT